MSRKPKILSVYERIKQTESEITSAERNLTYLKAQLDKLYEERDEKEMRETWKIIKEKGMSIEDVHKLLEQTNEKEK